MKTYSTSDFQLAVTLYTLGLKLVDLDKSNPKRFIFIFPDDPRAEEIEGQFFADSLQVNPRTLLVNSKLLKDRMYARY